MQTDLQQLDNRIMDLLAKRLLAAKAPMETCNQINDEINALRIERARVVERRDHAKV